MISTRRAYTLLMIVALAAVFLYSLHSIADFDTGYHLQTGAYVVAHGSVPLYDIFSLQGSGVRWIAHYWLSDVFFYFVYATFGVWGIILFAGVVSVMTWLIVMRSAYLRAGKSFLIPLLLLPYAYLTYEQWVVRPQIFTYLAAALLIYLLERWRVTKKKSFLAWSIALMLVWANLHAGVVLGIAIVGLYGIAYLYAERKHIRAAMTPLLFFIAAIAVTLVNPNGYTTLIYERIIGQSIQDVGTLEWKSILYFVSQRWQALAFLVFMAVVAGVVVWMVVSRMRKNRMVSEEDIASLGLIVGACALPLMSIRHVILFVIMTFPLFVMAVRTMIIPHLHPRMRDAGMYMGVALLGIFFLGGIAQAVGVRGIDDHTLPVGAAQFVLDHHIAGPMFDNMEMGGYLIWKLWPQQKVLFDGRSEIYAGKPNANYVAIFLGSAGWRQAWQTYNPNYVLVAYRNTNGESGRIVGDFLNRIEAMGYALVYWDDAAVVLLKNNAENKSVIDAYAYHDIGPFVDPASIPIGELKNAVVESRRALDAAPDSVEVRNFTTLLLQRVAGH